MTQCNYEAVGDGAYCRCRQCGHERRSNYPPHMLHRHCPASSPDRPLAEWEPKTPVDPRGCVECSLRKMVAKLGDDARPWPEITATLDCCFDGCKHMDKRVGHCTRRGSGCTCRKRWLEFVLFHECEQ